MSTFEDTNANYEKLKNKIFDLQFKIKQHDKNISELEKTIQEYEAQQKILNETIIHKKNELNEEDTKNNDLKKTLNDSNKNLEHIDSAISALSLMLDNY